MLQFRSDTGAILMLESGSLADGCICDFRDITAIMRSLSEARHYIATQNGINQEFGLGQGEAWPNQRTDPFEAPPSNGEDIPDNFYCSDYSSNIQFFYDDIQTSIDNYNYIKNFFQKTYPLEGSATVVNFSGADDYNPGVIDESNAFDAINDLIPLVNSILRVTIAATRTQLQRRSTFASTAIGNACDTIPCVQTKHPTTVLGHQASYGNACVLISDVLIVGTTIGVRSFILISSAVDGFASARSDSGKFTSNLTNFSQGQSDVYIRLDVANPADLFGQTPRPTAGAQGVFSIWSNAAFVVGSVQTSPVVDGSTSDPNQYAVCAVGVSQGISWETSGSVTQLTRSQTHVAS